MNMHLLTSKCGKRIGKLEMNRKVKQKMGVDLLAEQLVEVEEIIQGGTAVTSDNKRRNDRERRKICGLGSNLLSMVMIGVDWGGREWDQ
jgi:hypothetical protein